ncbi:hypothetical protein [Methylophaga sp.]|uniref:hypothetical protein n=1 Tax=Methylophaga sp. TaxID=2024840 RepID=UPI003A953380
MNTTEVAIIYMKFSQSAWLLFFVWPINNLALAIEDNQSPSSAEQVRSISTFTNRESLESLRSQIHHLEERVGSLEIELENVTGEASNNIELFDARVSYQNTKLLQLQDEVAQSKEGRSNLKTYEVWTSLLLACVAIIVTALGVGIALLSFIGYKTAIKKAEDKAAEIAESKASEIAESKAAETAREEITKKVEAGHFDDLIEDAVQKIAFGTEYDDAFEQDDDEQYK